MTIHSTLFSHPPNTLRSRLTRCAILASCLSLPPAADAAAQSGGARGDYARYLSAEPSPLRASRLVELCTQSLVDEWSDMSVNAEGTLATFLDYCTHGYKIDNVIHTSFKQQAQKLG